MPKYPQYIPIAREAFSAYLDNQHQLDTLLERLREIELQIAAEEEDDEAEASIGLWFRFFEGDPLKTSINDIAKDLSNPAHPNSLILLRGIAYSLQSGELEVHYS